jgi:hypothetical protein
MTANDFIASKIRALFKKELWYYICDFFDFLSMTRGEGTDRRCLCEFHGFIFLSLRSRSHARTSFSTTMVQKVVNSIDISFFRFHASR